MLLFIQRKFHESWRQVASVNWISFLGILCRYLFKMLNIYAIDSEFEVKLWCTNTIHVLCQFSYCYLFYVWIKFAIMWHLCTWKQCLLYVLNFCVLFCIVSCFVFAKYQYNCWTWKSVFWQLFFKAWNYVYVAALEKPFIKNDWMRISKVSIDTGILTWDFQSDNCIWIMAVFKISTLILLEKCQKVQEHFLVCPRTGVNIFFCRVTN